MKLLKKILPENLNKFLIKFYNKHLNPYYIKSYSQEGEDLILLRFFEGKKRGFYIDIGAHHPYRFSNTYLLYKLGWNGINIEPCPGSKRIFDKHRNRDINLEHCVSDKQEELTYYIFNEPALNGFSKEISLQRNELTEYKLLSEIRLRTKTLAEILDNYLLANIVIDFLTIDAEGWDYKVLLSNNWEKYLPQLILVEDLNFNLAKPSDSEIFNFLKTKGYKLFAKTVNTVFYELTK